ncbi:MAG: SRPBCC family protein [Candidatus Heimdallarchaeota archaeon]
MPIVTVTSKVEASVDQIWNVISNFEQPHRYHPYIIKTQLLSDQKQGIGAKRRCDMNDNTFVVEEVVEWIEKERITVDEAHFHAVSQSRVLFGLNRVTESISTVTIRMDYVRKSGFLGWLEEQITIKIFMKRVFKMIIKNIEDLIYSTS